MTYEQFNELVTEIINNAVFKEEQFGCMRYVDAFGNVFLWQDSGFSRSLLWGGNKYYADFQNNVIKY